jgi:5-methyltetrahydrofolate--homocysteine methyltransferase
MANLEKLAEYVIEGDRENVREIVQEAIDQKEDVSRILQEGLIAGMSVVGERFKKHECFVPEVLLAGRAMKEGMELLRPILTDQEIKGAGTVVVGTVAGDLHDIGKNLVGMMLEGAGFEVIDLGVDVSSEQFLKVAEEKQASLIGLSALLTTTMPAMRSVVEALGQSKLQDKVKIIIGGAPVTQEYAEEIGAAGYAADAASAVEAAKALVSD